MTSVVGSTLSSPPAIHSPAKFGAPIATGASLSFSRPSSLSCRLLSSQHCFVVLPRRSRRLSSSFRCFSGAPLLQITIFIALYSEIWIKISFLLVIVSLTAWFFFFLLAWFDQSAVWPFIFLIAYFSFGTNLVKLLLFSWFNL